MTVIIVLAFFAAVFAGYYVWWKNNSGQSAAAFNDLDMRIEAANASAYQGEFLASTYSFLTQHIKDAPINAFTTAKLDYKAADQAKDVAKNLLKGAATLGTVRFNTVQTPKYLVLSNGALHLLDAGVSGDIERHLVFDKSRLADATIEEMPVSNLSMKYGAFDLKPYMLSLPTDEGRISIMVFSGMIDPTNVSGAFLSTSSKTQVKEFVQGNYFLNKLGEAYPHLKVQTYMQA